MKGSIVMIACRNVNLSNTLLELRSSATKTLTSRRFLSHNSSGSCSCILCAHSPSLANRKSGSILNSAYHGVCKGKVNPLIGEIRRPISREDSESLVQKRDFFSFFGRKTKEFPYAPTSPSENESMDVEKLLKNNRLWAEKLKKTNPKEFSKLGETQTPKYLYIGCSDSRVLANEILGLGPGEVFVHRNVGNLVPGSDLNVLSVLEFAVGHLGVTDIIVAGHYNCGAVRAAVTRQDLGTLENWLRSIRDVYRIHRTYLDSIIDEEERHKKLVELSVVEQCINVYKTGIVQRKRMENMAKPSDYELKNAPRIHGVVFDTPNGILQRLDVDYSSVGELDSIYGLY